MDKLFYHVEAFCAIANGIDPPYSCLIIVPTVFLS